MRKKQQKLLQLIFTDPISANIKWHDVAVLLKGLGAELEEREGSRVAVYLHGHVTVQHRPHPGPAMNKGAVKTLRLFLKQCEVQP